MSTRRSPYSYCDCIILSRRCRRRRRFVASIFFVILIASSQPSPSASASASSSIALFSTTPLRHDRRPGLLHVVCRAPSSAYPSSTATTIITTHILPSLSASLTLTSHNMMPMNAVNGNSNSDCGGSSMEQNCIQEVDNNDNNTMSDITTMAFDDLPRHIAFICDGNSRWSEQQQRQMIQLKLPGFLPSSLAPMSMSTLGHAAGANRVVRLIDTLLSMRQKHYQRRHQQQQQNHPLNGRKEYPVTSIQYCTLFAFSTENWSRPYQEVAGLFQLLEQMAIHYSNHDIALREGRVRIQILGDMEDERIPISTRSELRKLEVKSKLACDDRRRRRRNSNDDSPATATADLDCGGNLVPRDEVDEDDDALTICLAINYGGRADILRAATELALSIIHESSSATSTSSSSDTALLLAEAVNEAEISKRLCTSALPNVDLIVRTGGERRLSNFFLWEGAYAELYFTDVFWPDFDEQELEKALVWYGKRNRRYGGR